MSLEDYFRGLSDPTRLRIFNLLLHQELCGSDIQRLLGITQPVVHKHSAFQVGVGATRRGRHQRCSIAIVRLVHMHEVINRFSRTKQELTKQLGRKPVPQELADRLGISVKKVYELMQTAQETLPRNRQRTLRGRYWHSLKKIGTRSRSLVAPLDPFCAFTSTFSANPSSRFPQQPNNSRSLLPLWRKPCSTWPSSE